MGSCEARVMAVLLGSGIVIVYLDRVVGEAL